MKKRLLLLLTVILTTLTARARDFEANGIYYNILPDEELACEVTSGDQKYTGDVVIPSTVKYNGDTYAVTEIGEYAFEDCLDLASINLPNSITTIRSHAFAYCENLPSIVLPSSLTLIEAGAFSGCRSFTSIKIPNTITSIADWLFQHCTNLTAIEIPQAVTTIGAGAFKDCSSLMAIEIPGSVTTIEGDAFNGCKALASITLPKSITTIGNAIFEGCTKLKEIISLNPTPPSTQDETFKGVSTTSCVLKVPVEAVSAYQYVKNWRKFKNVVGLTQDDINTLDITTVPASNAAHDSKAYRLDGTLAGRGHKGIIITNGKKIAVH